MHSNSLPPKHTLVIGCDSQDARFHRRIRMFRELGFVVSWLAFERQRTATPIPADVLSERHALLGVTRDCRYLQRIVALTLGLAKAYRWCRHQPGGFQLLYAINLDTVGDAKAHVKYLFEFTNLPRQDTASPSFLYNTGPITSLNDSDWQERQTLLRTPVRWRRRSRTSGRQLQ